MSCESRPWGPPMRAPMLIHGRLIGLFIVFFTRTPIVNGPSAGIVAGGSIDIAKELPLHVATPTAAVVSPVSQRDFIFAFGADAKMSNHSELPGLPFFASLNVATTGGPPPGCASSVTVRLSTSCGGFGT